MKIGKMVGEAEAMQSLQSSKSWTFKIDHFESHIEVEAEWSDIAGADRSNSELVKLVNMAAIGRKRQERRMLKKSDEIIEANTIMRTFIELTEKISGMWETNDL